jgi:hypothetical protein
MHRLSSNAELLADSCIGSELFLQLYQLFFTDTCHDAWLLSEAYSEDLPRVTFCHAVFQ